MKTPHTLSPNLKVVGIYRRSRLRGRIVQGDALAFLRSLPQESADIVFLDPPFNLGKKYSPRNRRLDKKPEAEYGAWLSAVVLESSRVLAKGGALYLYHLPKWAMLLGSVLAEDSELRFLHWIAISMKNGFVRGERLYPAHYALLLFTKRQAERVHKAEAEAYTMQALR